MQQFSKSERYNGARIPDLEMCWVACGYLLEVSMILIYPYLNPIEAYISRKVKLFLVNKSVENYKFFKNLYFFHYQIQK